jgi:hypothetical protein
MLDLKALEAKVNAALEAETTESLTQWLLEQRRGDLDMHNKTNISYLESFLYTSSSQQVNSITFSSKSFNAQLNYSHYTYAA